MKSRRSAGLPEAVRTSDLATLRALPPGLLCGHMRPFLGSVQAVVCASARDMGVPGREPLEQGTGLDQAWEVLSQDLWRQ